nr:retrovirus-related Pol polyprotein from transposon 297 family [Tanacetum cinerariifolium]
MNRVTDISEGLLQRELLVSEPSLGYAFYLTRVTEARWDDQGVGVNSWAASLPIKWISPADDRSVLVKACALIVITNGSRSLQLWGTLGAGKVHMLIDNGSTHNFVQLGVVKRMQLPITGNDRHQGFTHGCGFVHQGYTLRGDEALRMKRISLHHMRASLEKKDSSTKEKGSSTDVQVITHPDIEQLLARFKEIFQWGGSEGNAFNELKDKLTHAPILCLLDFEDTFAIESDASDMGIGAVLLRKGQPLGYFSRKLGPRMRIATTYQKELFSIVEAVYKWR